MFPWLCNVIAQRSTGTAVCFCQWQRRWRWLRFWVCDDFNVFEEGKRVQVFDWILVSVEITTLSWFNASGGAANSQIVLACNLKVFRMVWFDMFKSPTVWGELVSAWKFGAMERGLLWHCRRHGRSGVFTIERDESWCWAWVVWCGYKLTILERFIEPQHHHKEVTYTPAVAKTLHVQCLIILWMK